MSKSGGEKLIPIDVSMGDVYHRTDIFRQRVGFRDNSRLALLGGVIWHPSVKPVLESASHHPWKFDFVISRMKNPRGKNPPTGNLDDIFEQAYEEAKSRGTDMVYPKDLMIGFLRLQPPPVDRVIAALEIDRMAIIEELRNSS